jgi:hypothetical protein
MIKPLERPLYLDRISSTWNLETDGTGCIRGSSRHQFISTGSFSEQDYGARENFWEDTDRVVGYRCH